jgi:hypothetical protein
LAVLSDERLTLYRKTVESYDNAIREAEGKREISNRWIPLDANIPDDPQVKSMIDAYRQECP